MSSTLQSSVFTGRDYSENLHSIKNTRNNLTLKQMVDISAIVGSRTVRWDFWSVSYQLGRLFMETNYHWSMMKKSSVCRMQRFMFFRIPCYILERWIRTQHKTMFGKKKLSWFKDSPQYRTLDTIDGEPMEFEWNIFPGFTTLQLINKVQEDQNGRPITTPGTNYLHVDVQWHHIGDLKTMNGNALLTPHLWLYLQKKVFQQDIGHSSDLDQKQSGFLLGTKGHKEKWDKVAELMMIKFGESGHPVFRATSPLSRGTFKSKGGGKWSVHFCAGGDTIETDFRTIISVNQLSIYGAVSDVCDEYSACPM